MALNARLTPLKSVGTEVLDAAICACRVLYPELAGAASIPELCRHLLASEDRLREWRSSSARAGADRALQFILSLYEGINIDTVRSLRAESHWLKDPTSIQARQEAADFFAEWTVTKYLTPGRVYPDDDVVVEDGADAEASSGEEHDDAESSSEAFHAISDVDKDATPTETAVPDANAHPDAATATTATSTPGTTNPVDSVAPSSAASHDGDVA